MDQLEENSLKSSSPLGERYDYMNGEQREDIILHTGQVPLTPPDSATRTI